MKRTRFKLLLSLLAVCLAAFVGFGMTNYPDGVASYGIPLPAGDYLTSGTYLFVNSQSQYAQDSYPAYGANWDKPLKTIKYAATKVTANHGDIIFVAPGHYESVNKAGDITFSRAGVRVVALGTGDQRPKIYLSGVTGTVAINAADISLENFRIGVTDTAAGMAGVTVIDSGITIAAKNFRLINSEYIMARMVGEESGASTTHSAAISVPIDGKLGCTGAYIANNDFRTYGAGASLQATAPIGVSTVFRVGDSSHDVMWRDNRINGYVRSGVSLASGVSAARAGVSNFYATNNTFYSTYAGASAYIQGTGSYLGTINGDFITTDSRETYLGVSTFRLANITYAMLNDKLNAEIPYFSIPNAQEWGHFVYGLNFAGDAESKGIYGHEIATVNGECEVKILAYVHTTGTGAANICLGLAGGLTTGKDRGGATAFLIPPTLNTHLSAGAFWYNTGTTPIETSPYGYGPAYSGVSTTKNSGAIANGTTPYIVGGPMMNFIVGNGKDIGYTVGSAGDVTVPTAGGVSFYVWWRPLTPGSYIVKAASGVTL